MTTTPGPAARFARTREAHRVEIAEDYVEVVLDLIDGCGEARMSEIADKLGVAHPTVAKALNRLKRDGLVELRAYKPVRLTEKGLSLARQCRDKHRTVVRFLVVLGQDPEAAELEAEGIEHHVSSKTLKLMSEFADKAQVR
jgi:DtxR family transcriptional regulator, manganese transport regulator